MKRPLCVIGFPFAGAMSAAFFFGGSASLYLSAAAALTGAAFYLLNRKKFLALCIACLAAAAAFGEYGLYHYRTIEPFEKASGNVITIEGIITEMSASTRSTNYTVKASFPRVSLPDTYVSVQGYGEIQAGVGDIIRCRITLRPAYGTYYYSRGIMARGVLKGEMLQISLQGYGFERWKIAVRSFFERNLYTKLKAQNASIVGTMVMKVGAEPDSALYAHMNKSGITHLLSISGVHFSILSSFVLMVLGRLRLPRRIPELLTIALSSVFVLLAGLSAPVVRAFIMFLIAVAGSIFMRRGDALNSLGLSMLVICAVWPVWTQSIGTWLSAFSTLGILVSGQRLAAAIYEKIRGRAGRLGGAAKLAADSAGISIGAYGFTLPLLAMQNGWISLVAPLTNLFIAPFVTPALVGGMLCAVIPTGAFPVNLIALAADFCCDAIVRISEIMAALSFMTVSLDKSYILIWIAAAALTAAVLAYFKAGRRLVTFGLALCLLSLSVGSVSARAAENGKIELITLEKCGSVILLRDGEAVIVGVPDRYGASELIRYLDYRGVNRISCLAAYDMGNNVDSGVIRLAESYEILCAIGPDDAYLTDLLAHAVKGVPVYPCGYAEIEVLGGATVGFAKNGSTARIAVGGREIYRCKGAYDPDADTDPGAIFVYSLGGMLLPDGVAPALELVGQSIYGETRLIFDIGG